MSYTAHIALTMLLLFHAPIAELTADDSHHVAEIKTNADLIATGQTGPNGLTVKPVESQITAVDESMRRADQTRAVSENRDPLSLISGLEITPDTTITSDALGIQQVSCDTVVDAPMTGSSQVTDRPRLFANYRLAFHLLGALRGDRTRYRFLDGSETEINSGGNGGFAVQFVPDRLKQTESGWGFKFTSLFGSGDTVQMLGVPHQMTASLVQFELNRYVPVQENLLGDQFLFGLAVVDSEDEITRTTTPGNEVFHAENRLIGPTIGLADMIVGRRFRIDATIRGGVMYRQTNQSAKHRTGVYYFDEDTSGVAGLLLTDVGIKRQFRNAFQWGLGFQSMWLMNVIQVREMRTIFAMPSAGKPHSLTYAGLYLIIEKNF